MKYHQRRMILWLLHQNKSRHHHLRWGVSIKVGQGCKPGEVEGDRDSVPDGHPKRCRHPNRWCLWMCGAYHKNSCKIIPLFKATLKNYNRERSKRSSLPFREGALGFLQLLTLFPKMKFTKEDGSLAILDLAMRSSLKEVPVMLVTMFEFSDEDLVELALCARYHFGSGDEFAKKISGVVLLQC